jgi:hypothetical protein
MPRLCPTLFPFSSLHVVFAFGCRLMANLPRGCAEIFLLQRICTKMSIVDKNSHLLFPPLDWPHTMFSSDKNVAYSYLNDLSVLLMQRVIWSCNTSKIKQFVYYLLTKCVLSYWDQQILEQNHSLVKELLSTCICVYRIPFEMRSLSKTTLEWVSAIYVCARMHTFRYTLSMYQRPTFLAYSNFKSAYNPRNSITISRFWGL